MRRERQKNKSQASIAVRNHWQVAANTSWFWAEWVTQTLACCVIWSDGKWKAKEIQTVDAAQQNEKRERRDFERQEDKEKGTAETNISGDWARRETSQGQFFSDVSGNLYVRRAEGSGIDVG